MKRTEEWNPLSKGIEDLPVNEFLNLMHKEDRKAFDSVGKALPQIRKAVEAAMKTISRGGKVYYVGAGTSGRLGVLDAVEVKPTFGSDAFRAFIAGGRAAMFKSIEGAEDDMEKGAKDASVLTEADMAIGISASGSTRYVNGFLQAAKAKKAYAWLITSNRVKHEFLDGIIFLNTGPEVILGSTRLKAATAQKLALNMISTIAMSKLGGSYNGLMVDVRPTNEKLVKRAKAIISRATGCATDEAGRLLEKSGNQPKLAILMYRKKISRRKAQEILKKNQGTLRGLF